MIETDQALKKIRKSKDYLRSEDNREWLSEVEKDLEQLKTDAAFQKLDQVKMLRQKIKSIIVSASKRLVDEDDVQKRLKIKADREAYVWLLRYFSKNIDREMAEINEKLNEKLGEL